MVAEADDALMEKFFDAGTLTQEELLAGLEARRSRRHASSRWSARRRQRTSACSRCSTRSSRTCRLPPSARSRRATRRAATTSASRRRTPARVAAFIWKTVADPFAGRITMFRVVTGHAEGGLDRPERHPGQCRSGSGTSCCCRARRRRTVPEIKAGDIGAVAKLKETQTNDLIADKAAGVQRAADQVPGAGDLLRNRAEEPRRRREDQHGAAPAAGRGPDHQLHPRSADEGAAARRSGPVAHRGHGREAEAAVRRRGQSQAAADPVPRDDHGVDRGARPPQEADRRPRSVR